MNTDQQTYILSLLQENFNSLDKTDEDAMHDARQWLASISKFALSRMSLTSTKQNTYDVIEVECYIDRILERGYSLKPSRPSDDVDFEGVQLLRCYDSLIKERVEASEFSTKRFKATALRFQRSAIEQAKTIHELRQAVNNMIGPLELWNENQALLHDASPEQLAQAHEATMDEMEVILLELEAMTELAATRKRVLDEVLAVYDEGLEDVATLRNCEAAKKQYKLSDEAVAKMFGMSRKKLLKLRASVLVL